jgi:GNAT superfamily N-acetyltransferase
VDVTHVGPVAAELIAGLAPQRSRLLLALDGDVLAGWLNIRREPNPLVAHWGVINHLQTRDAFRGRGVGTALMTEARRVAREEMGLEQLRLAARGGVGLERFYARLGWKEVGRWPGALRLAPDDDRDEILMLLDPL